MSAHLEYGYRSVRVTGTYNPVWVEEIKQEIPKSRRAYDPYAQVWTFWDPYVDVAGTITREAYKQVTESGREAYDAGAQSGPDPRHSDPGGSKASGVSGDADFGVLFLRDDAPEYVAKAVYKALATTLHPDRGGQVAEMQRLNAAWDRIRAKKGW